MPKTFDYLAPLRELQTKAEGLVSKMDSAVFDRLGIFIAGEVEVWKTTFETNMRLSVQAYRAKILTQLQLHSERARVRSPAKLDEEHEELLAKLSTLNVGFEELFNIFQRIVSMMTEDDPRREFLNREMHSIRSTIEAVKEGEEECQDKFAALKRAVQFLVLPENQFEALLDLLRPLPDHVDLRLLNPKLVRLERYSRSRHEWFEEIQNILADAATKWLNQKVSNNEQRKVLRAMQKLYRLLQAQVDKQDLVLTNLEEYREWVVEAPIFLAHDRLGTIEATELLSALEEYNKDVTEVPLFAVLDYATDKVNTFVADLEVAMEDKELSTYSRLA